MMKKLISKFELGAYFLRTTPRRCFSIEAKESIADQTIQRDQNDTKHDDDETYVSDIKKKILSASMDFVPEMGWSKEAIGQGAQTVGYVSTVHGLFPHGGAHLVHHFASQCNENLTNSMKEKSENVNDGNRLKFLEDSIVTRIEMLNPYKKSWNHALSTIVGSKMAPDYLKIILTLSDEICYYAGDRSIDSHWYLQRVAIAGIYQSSELHWLGNEQKSEEIAISEMRKFTESQLKLSTALYEAPQFFSAIFQTIQNIIPINKNR